MTTKSTKMFIVLYHNSPKVETSKLSIKRMNKQIVIPSVYYLAIKMNELLQHDPSGSISKPLCWANEARHIRAHIVWLHLHELLEQTKQINGGKKSDQDCCVLLTRKGYKRTLQSKLVQPVAHMPYVHKQAYNYYKWIERIIHMKLTINAVYPEVGVGEEESEIWEG